MVDIPQTIDKIVEAIRKREENPQYPDNPVHDAIQDLPMDIRSTGDPALRNQLKQTQIALETLQSDRDKLFQKLIEIDPSRAFTENQNEINVDTLLDQAEEIMHSTGEHALLRLKNSLIDGGTEAFVKELRSVLKSPYLDENDFLEIVKICRQLGLEGHRIAALEIARARYPYSNEMLLAQIDAYDDSKNRQDNERGRVLIEEYLHIKHTEQGPAMTTNTASFKHENMSIGLLFNFYRKANKLDWILSIANSADALGLKSSLIERNRASALSNLGRLDEAEKSFLRAIEINPNDDQAVSWYADFLDDAGKYEEAYESFENAIFLDPQDGGSFVNLGIHILNRGLIPTDNGSFIGPVSNKDRVKAVVPLFIKAIELSPVQSVIQKIVRVLVRADAVYEAETFAEGKTPEGNYNLVPLSRIVSRLGN